MAATPSLLIKVTGDSKALEATIRKNFGIAAGAIEKILEIPATPSRLKNIAAEKPSAWFRVRAAPAQGDNLWNHAHALCSHAGFSIAMSTQVRAVEPDFEQQWNIGGAAPSGAALPAAPHDPCIYDPQDSDGGKAAGSGVAWNFGDRFSQLGAARRQVNEEDQARILIAHLDTGYDSKHITLPKNIQLKLQRCFVEGDAPENAEDQVPIGQVLPSNRGHGTGTLSLLAGNKLDGSSPGWETFTDYLGGAPYATVVPVRIADWVVRFTTSTMVQGFDYARSIGAHVLSMSMGGLSSQALVDAVNLAYEAGIFMVTAAGNNYASLPTPKSTVFPARLKRVLSACGVMANGHAYAGLKTGTMQGNFGPDSKMDTSLGAYTPNVPWAKLGCINVVDMDGAGTSAATPQIAAAAALWLASHWDEVVKYPEPWMRVEAARHALFVSALKATEGVQGEELHGKLGQGVMRAASALRVQPLPAEKLTKLEPAQASWSFLNLIIGRGGVSLAGDSVSLRRQRQSMLALELTQMAQRVVEVDEAIDDPGRPADQIPAAARNRYLEAALDSGRPSDPLRAMLESILGKGRPAAKKGGIPSATTITRKATVMPVPNRRLRIYALDPSIAKNLASLSVNETVLSIPWDDEPVNNEALQPGPVGEYLEVVDIDPASNMVYDPVDLNDKFILAQDGVTPSEGNPQFHQQMVYAVGMTTIRHFELALGRTALWAPRVVQLPNGKIESYEVPKLRIYPHALRTDNAYYSPEKRALLFGYFSASSQDGDATAPGSMIFSCLSSDVIAHEMSHALLDGLHRRFQEKSNLDVPAFHEAFADIVALFQHFTVTELVRFEIARVRGDLSAAKLLGGLARQFGEGMGRAGPLRDYSKPSSQNLKYDDATEVHDRGSILVYAVYEAFQNIVSRRTEDLRRIATGGSGILPPGALMTELVERLTSETCKVARHVLHMAIRALDYCPAVDITFGEYLRALITADIDVMPADQYAYRVAFMEAFRNRGILPRDVRTISQESLAWDTPEKPKPDWLTALLKGIDVGWNRKLPRSEVFALNRDNCKKARGILKNACLTEPSLYAHFGLVPGVSRYDQKGNLIHGVSGDDTTFDVSSIRPVRRVAPDGTFRTDINAVIQQRQKVLVDDKDPSKGWFWFRGGVTLILDAREGYEVVRYAIVKNSSSERRKERQRQIFADGLGSPLSSLYFGESRGEPFAVMHGFG